jgi:hypothetical protein
MESPTEPPPKKNDRIDSRKASDCLRWRFCAGEPLAQRKPCRRYTGSAYNQLAAVTPMASPWYVSGLVHPHSSRFRQLSLAIRHLPLCVILNVFPRSAFSRSAFSQLLSRFTFSADMSAR